MTIHPDKTRIARLEDGFAFLGFNVRKYGPKTLIKPSAEAVKRVKDKIRRIVEQSPTTELLIRRLNPLIEGWATYYRGAVAKEIFADLRPLRVAQDMEMGPAAASPEKPVMDQGPILRALPFPARRPLGIRRSSQWTGTCTSSCGPSSNGTSRSRERRPQTTRA